MSSATDPVSPRTERLNTKAAGIISLAVMCSRVLGLLREQIFAALFGGGAAMDEFTTAFRIPNLLRDLFAEGALSTAFVTTFSKTIATRGDEAAWHLANKVATMTFLVLGVICVAGMLGSNGLVALLGSGFSPEKAALTVHLTRIMFPFILLVSLAALVMGMLNAKNVFGMPAMASSFFNLGSIIGGVTLGYWLDPHFGLRSLTGLAFATLIGGALQLMVQLPALARLGYRFRPDFNWRDVGVKSILLLMGPSVIAASTTQINVLVNSSFASSLGDGRIFWLAIAFRLMMLPLGLFGVALGTVSLPLLSRLVAAQQMDAVRSELARAMRLSFLLTIPSMIGLMLLAEPIISVLYQHGKFSAVEAAEAAGALRFYAIGLPAYAALKVLVNAFYALERRKTPMLVSVAAVALNLALSWFFTFQLGWGHRGLAFSTGCVATFNFVLLYALMRSHLHGLDSKRMAESLFKVGVACVPLAAVCVAANIFLLADWARQPFWTKAGGLTLAIVVAGAAFAAASLALHIDEVGYLANSIRRRLQRNR